jgi:PAS domain S-box-containing protein
MMDSEQRAVTQPEPGAPKQALLAEHVFASAIGKTRMAMAFADPNLPDCPIVYLNPAFTELTGYTLESALGRNCRFLQGPETDPEAVARIRRAITERRPVTEELYNYRSDGSGFWNALYVSPIFDENGKLIYFFASQIDVSSHRQAMRRQAQRMESMAALASGVAHEFNNLMTVVLGSVEQATARATDDRVKTPLERADWASKRAGALASELLSLTRRQVAGNQRLDLNKILHEIEKPGAEFVSDRLSISLDLADSSIFVRLDRGQLELALLSLLRNAADAMPEGGTVTFATRVLPASEAAATLFGDSKAGQEAIELTIEDSGHGMPPEVLKRATELFFTTKTANRGTGVGLFLVLEFVEKSGGRLLIDSKPDQGTRVRLIFPRESAR